MLTELKKISRERVLTGTGSSLRGAVLFGGGAAGGGGGARGPRLPLGRAVLGH